MKTIWSISVTRVLLGSFVLLSLACESKKNSNYLVLSSPAQDAGVVYGEYSIKPVARKDSTNFSVAAIIEKENLEQSSAGTVLQEVSVLERFGTCEELSLTPEMSGAKCTGVLIENNVVVTAGHCFNTFSTCEQFAVAFGFANAGKNLRTVLKNENVYNCKSLKIDSEKDIAYIQLDRAVPQFKKPVARSQFSTDSLLGLEVYTLGHPLGTSLKRTEGFIRGYDSKTHLVKTTLDAFDRNSGSPVFLSKTNELLGILLNGEVDFFETSSQSCQQVVKCKDNECIGESVLAIDQVF